MCDEDDVGVGARFGLNAGCACPAGTNAVFFGTEQCRCGTCGKQMLTGAFFAGEDISVGKLPRRDRLFEMSDYGLLTKDIFKSVQKLTPCSNAVWRPK